MSSTTPTRRARPGKLGQRVAGAELEHAEARQPAGKRGELEGGPAAGTAVAAPAPRFLDDAVGVTDEGAVAAAGEDGAIAAVEDGARDGARVVERAREVDIFRRNEALELAPQRFGHRFGVGVQQDRHALVLALDRKALHVADHVAGLQWRFPVPGTD
jgi:hypothetical protein